MHVDPADPVGSGGLVGRIGRAFVGWLPIALGIGWLAGELSGCARFSADCDAGWMPTVWLATLAVLALLFIVPRFAAAATVAALATLVTAVPGALYLASTRATGDAATGEASVSSMGVAVLGGSLVAGWVVGFVIGLARAMRRGPRPVS